MTARHQALLAQWAADDAAEAPGGTVTGALRLGFATLLLVVLGLGLWGLGARITGAIVAQGVVTAGGGPVPVAAAMPGIVAKTFAEDGDVVAAGAILLRLDDAALHREAQAIAAELAALAARRARLLAEAEGALATVMDDPDQAALLAAARAADAARSRAVQAQDAALAAELAGLAADRRTTDRQLALLRAALDDKRALAARGLAMADTLRGLDREIARLEGVLDRTMTRADELAARRAALARGVEAAQAERRHAARVALGDLAATERDLLARRSGLDLRLARLDVVSPVGGTVVARQVLASGAVIGAGQPLLHVVPNDAPLTVTARIDPAHADAVAAGQAARLVFASARPGTPPEVAGTVLRLSAETLADPAMGGRWFEAVIRPDAEALSRLPGGTPQPGTPVEVYLVTGEAAPLAWLARPFLRHLGRVFRDG